MMTHIVPLSTSIFASRLAVPFPRYAQIVGYAEPAFFGVAHPDNDKFQCREIWSHDQRIAVYRALQEAQSELENVTEFPLMPTWFSAERHPVGSPLVLDHGKLIQMGQLAIANISLGEVCNHASDPVLISIVGQTFTDPNEVHVYHPNSNVEIYPSSVNIIGGTLVIYIPRVRMVTIADEDNPVQGLDYSDTSLFEATVDIKREYPAVNGTEIEFVSFGCGDDCDCPLEVKTPGCAQIIDNEMSILHAGITGCACLPYNTHYIDAYYQAGLVDMTPAGESVMVRLAHARMPNEPCGCNILKGRWLDDQKVPDILTAERENCPFGMSNGAWQAYEFAQNLRQYRMSVL